ncbi:MAG: lipopolysaccharide biosynthesis protein [Nitrospirota bacterium]
MKSEIKKTASQPQQSLTKMAGIIAIGRFISLFIAVLLPLLLVRIFDQEEFGLYKQIFLIADTIPPLLGFSLGKNVFYFFPRKQDMKKTIVINILFIYLLIGIAILVVFIFYPEAINLLFKSQAIAGFLLWIGIYVTITLLASFFEDVIIANGEIMLSSVVVVLTTVSRAIFLIAAVLILQDLYSLMFAAIIFSILRLTAFLIYLSKRFRGFSYTINNKLLKEQLLYTLPFGIAAFIWHLSRNMHFFFITSFYTPKMFAIYSVGAFQIPFLYVINYSVGNIMIAEMSKLQAKGEIDEVKTIFMNAIRKISLLYLPLFFFLLIIREEFIITLFTEQYLDSVPFFTVNLLSILLLIPFVNPVFRAFSEYRYYRLKVSLLGLFILPLILYLFFKIMGAIGVVWGNIAVNLITQIILLLKCFNILLFSSSEIISLCYRIGKISLTSAIASLSILFFKHLTTLQTPFYILSISTIIYAIVYTSLIYYFNLITTEEKQKIKDIIFHSWKEYGYRKWVKHFG